MLESFSCFKTLSLFLANSRKENWLFGGGDKWYHVS